MSAVQRFQAEVLMVTGSPPTQTAKVRRAEEDPNIERPEYPVLGGVAVGEWVWCLESDGSLIILDAGVQWSDVLGKPASFPPSGHTHDWADVINEPSTWPPLAHASSHISTGSDPIAAATPGGASGLMTGADKAELDRHGTVVFSVYQSTAQLDLTSAAYNLIRFQTETWDPFGWFDNATNFRFQPGILGRWLLAGATTLNPGVDQKLVWGTIHKNGSLHKAGARNSTSGTVGVGGFVAAIVENTVLTDYFDFRLYHNLGVNTSDTLTGAYETWFMGAYLGAT